MYKSLALINFPQQNLHFLSSPDGGLSKIYNADHQQPYLNTLTQKSATYSASVEDYHSSKFQQAAPYTKQSLLQDLQSLIEEKQPQQIYVTSAFDGHGDHQAAFDFTRDAALAAGYTGTLNTYLIHSGNHHGDWPYPYKQDHQGLFESHRVDGQQVPAGLVWPPQIRVPLTLQQSQKKLEMINQFDAEILTAADYMRAFVKAEEIFWPVSPKEK